MFYWEDFIKYIENTDLAESDIYNISEFIAFIKLVLGKQDLSLTLNLEEMALLQNPKDFAVAKTLLPKLEKIIIESAEKVKVHFEEEKINYELCDTKNEFACYFYAKNNNKYLLFFGLWFSIIKYFPELSDYLFCYGLNTETTTKEGEYQTTDGEYLFEEEYIEKFRNKNNIVAGSFLIDNFNKYDLAHDEEKDLIDNISEILIDTIEKLTK